MMRYTTERIDDNHVRFRFTIPYAELEAAQESIYRATRDQLEIPGIRRGKADRRLLESYFGKTVFAKPAIHRLVSESCRKAMAEFPEEIFYSPTVTIEQKKPERDLIFIAQVKINPEVTLCDYRSVTLEKQDVDAIERTVRELPESERDSTLLYLLQSALVSRIAEKSTLEIPDTMIQERAMDMAREFQRRLEQNHESLEEYYRENGSNEKELLKDFTAAAKRQLQSRLTLLAIARAEGLEASEAEYDSEIHRLSSIYLLPPEQLREFFLIREGIKLKQDIGVAKAADFIKKMVQDTILKSV